MNLIKLSVEKPIAVLSIVLMVVLYGLMALVRIPIQLTPDINRPVIEITTDWPGTAPADVEREIVVRQEEVLKGLNGLKDIVSTASTGQAKITLEFNINSDMDKMLLLVSNRLDRVGNYPEEVDEPILRTASSEDSPIAWIVLKTINGNKTPMYQYGTFANDVIRERLLGVNGVADVNVYGGSELEMQIEIDPETLARYRLTVSDLARVLQNANISLSAGDVDEGKRRYVIRTESEYLTLEQVENVVVRSAVQPDGQIERVLAKDIATVRFGYKEPSARIRHMGEGTIAINAVRETGANVITTMRELKKAVQELNELELKTRDLYFRQVYDETVYIHSAIDLVQRNILVGGLLAACILMLFLRSWRATLVISLSIPVSVIGSFVAMSALGRSINVISLAGIAFAVGMVVDAAIVVLENIYRYQEKGMTPKKAAVIGAQQVWVAIFVSALTTVMVFAPVLAMDLEIGQLFRDIAVAISVSVLLSLLVAITVIPALVNYLFSASSNKKKKFKTIQLPFVDNLAQIFTSFIMRYLEAVFNNRLLALGSVFSITTLAIISTWFFLPKLEYLPEGNRNLIFGVILPPPGYNLDTTFEIASRIEANVKPLWIKDGEENHNNGPLIKNFFFVSRDSRTIVGAIAQDPKRVKELIPILSRPIFQEPGTFGFVTQSSLFGRAVGSGRVIDLDISGPELEPILEAAVQAVIKIQELFPRQQGHQLRPIPGIELGSPEVRVEPDPIRVSDNGLSNVDVARAVKVFNDGLRLAELNIGGKRIDLTLMGPRDAIKQTQGIKQIPIITPKGEILPLESLANVYFTAGPIQIRHKGGFRTVTLQIRPNNATPLEVAMETLQQQIIEPLIPQVKEQGINIQLSGTADKLTETWNHMVVDLMVALVVVYLVMAILFGSFFYPLIILFSVPVAAAGGVMGLGVLNLFTFQALDMLTMLGFVILIGIVVNNAILIVHHSLQHLREDKMNLHDSVLSATRDRIRPIFMSTLTSLFGMLPLVLFPGAGSELYRGLGSVVVGGLSLSALLTLLMIPALLRFSRVN